MEAETVESLDLKKSLTEPVPQMSFERKAEGAILHRNLVLQNTKVTEEIAKLKSLESQFQGWLSAIAAENSLADNEWTLNLDTFEFQKNVQNDQK